MSEPTVVFVFELKHWYNTISPLSKLDLLDIVPQVCVQFGYDFQSQAFLMVITKTKWTDLSGELKKKFMMISRRIKEEMEGPMSTSGRESYENTDLFHAFEASKAAGSASAVTPEPSEAKLETIPEEV
jgi:hypothetical protein